MTAWTLDRARHAYSIPYWSDGYFDVDAQGRMTVLPRGAGGPALPLPQVVDQATAAGLKLPLLLRFSDILGDRLGKLQAAFAQAQRDWDYNGGYTAVYPIKVNQHQGVAGTLATHHGEGFGLEAGSKPELMAVLALSRPGGLIVCNGYKDREYIRLALIGRKLGLQTYIVIEKPSELKLVLEEAQALGVKPGLGVRMRLASLGAGKWQNSGGDKAKFGLSPRQLLDLWKRLRDAGMGDCLQLLHFHMGSQISNVRDIANGMREATRYFVELSKLGANISHVDVGGGLGIDYEGTRSRSYNSVNYGIHHYASSIVQPLAEACQAEGIAAPRIVTDGLRRRELNVGRIRDNVSHTLTADEETRQGRVRSDVLPFDADGHQTVAVHQGVRSVRTSSGTSHVDTLGNSDTSYLPFAALDGDRATAWRSDPYASATGQWIEITFDTPRRITELNVDFVDDLRVGLPVGAVRIGTDQGIVTSSAP